MAENAQPSIDPADDGSMVGLFRMVLGKFLQGLDDMLPAKVIAFDRQTNRAQVQPLIMMLTTEGTTVSRAQIASVPVFQIGGGGFILNFNLKPGDLGWIKATDRDMSLFLQGFKEAGPNTLRKHSFEDAVFFPDAMKGFTIAGEDEENVVLQTLDGSHRIAIWPDKVKVTSDTEIVLDAPMTTITGQLRTGTAGGGSATFGGTINAVGDITTQVGNISLGTHRHTGVDPGGGTSGGPTP